MAGVTILKCKICEWALERYFKEGDFITKEVNIQCSNPQNSSCKGTMVISGIWTPKKGKEENGRFCTTCGNPLSGARVFSCSEKCTKIRSRERYRKKAAEKGRKEFLNGTIWVLDMDGWKWSREERG